MNMDKLRQEIADDEGVKLNENGQHIIYLDHLALPTCGVGHLIVEDDDEYGQPVGAVVSDERVRHLFARDCAVMIEDCKVLYSDFDDLPEEAQLIIANMMFNMGRPRLSKFKGMKAGVDARDWSRAADEMVDSRWYDQVTNRAKRLVARMRSLEDQA